MTELTLHHYGNPQAPTLLLVHGLTDDGTNWPDAVAHWGQQWSLVAVDLRGHGTSPRFDRAELSRAADRMLTDLTELLADFPTPPVLVGHSLGGYLGARIARDAPELLRAAVLEDPAKPADVGFVPDPDEVGFGPMQAQFVEQVTADPAAAVARMRGEAEWSDAELQVWAASKARVDRTYLAEGALLSLGPWEVGLFDQIAVPTLVVVPENGPMAPDLSLVNNPLVERADIEGAGHCVRRDRPAGYFAAVDEFLARLPR